MLGTIPKNLKKVCLKNEGVDRFFLIFLTTKKTDLKKNAVYRIVLGTFNKNNNISKIIFFFNSVISGL